MSDCCSKDKYPDHIQEISRLNRIAGQVDGVKKMIEERRYCPDIMIQLKAISAAAQSIEGNILRAHLQGCVAKAFESKDCEERDQKIEELVSLFKKID